MLFLPWAAHVDGCGNSLTFPDAGVPALSSLDADLEVFETSHHRRAPVPGLAPRQRNPLELRRRACDDGARLHAREFGTDALVHSVPERRVLGSRACPQR